MKTKVKIFTGIDSDQLEKEINDWIERKVINITSISTAMTVTNFSGQYNSMITILYIDGISGV